MARAERKINDDFRAAWKATYPTIETDAQNTDYSVLLDKLRTALPGNAAPMLVRLQILGGVRFSSKGYREPLKPEDVGYSTADFWPGAMKSVPVSALTNTQNENQAPFIAGQLAMMIAHPSEYARMLDLAFKATGADKEVADAVVAKARYGLIPKGPARRAVVFGGSNIQMITSEYVDSGLAARGILRQHPDPAGTDGADGGWRVTLVGSDGWTLPLAPENAAKAPSARTPAVVLGARHSTITLHLSQVANALPCKVNAVEPTGDVTFVQVYLDRSIVIISLDPNTQVRPDQPVWLDFNQNRLHLFDGETQLAL